jgi:hypothetical protein
LDISKGVSEKSLFQKTITILHNTDRKEEDDICAQVDAKEKVRELQ